MTLDEYMQKSQDDVYDELKELVEKDLNVPIETQSAVMDRLEADMYDILERRYNQELERLYEDKVDEIRANV